MKHLRIEMTTFSPLPLIVVGLHETGGNQEDTNHIGSGGAGSYIDSEIDDGGGGGGSGVWVGSCKSSGCGVGGNIGGQGDADGEFLNKNVSSARHDVKKPGKGY